MTKIFISYSRKDLEFVEELASDLEGAGLDVWYDLSGLEGGSRWSQEIEKAIRACDHVIMVVSPDSIASKWVEEEFLLAGELKKNIIPLHYRQSSIPFGYRTLHFIDIQGSKYQKNLYQVLRSLNINREDAQKFIAEKTNEEATEKSAKEEAETDAAEKAAREKAAKEAAEKVAKEETEQKKFEKAKRQKEIATSIKPQEIFTGESKAESLGIDASQKNEKISGIIKVVGALLVISFFYVVSMNLQSAFNSPVATQTPDANLIFTVAAQTVEASLTQSASSSLPVITQTTTIIPSLAPVQETATPSCNKAAFIYDVTIPDYTVFKPGETFIKTWRFKNTGSCTWNADYSLVFISGDSMNGPTTQAFSGIVSPGQTVDISVQLQAPNTSGTYRGNWMFQDGSGLLFSNTGEPFWAIIEVE